jgi:glyoxylase I family protein
MFVGLEHTAIASPSPAKLAQWYVDHLGFRINFEYDGNYFVRAKNGAMLEIIPSEGARAEQKMRDEGIRHLAIEVTDFDAAHAALKAQGVNFTGQPYVNQGNQLVFFTDCDGNFVHLIQREKALP